MKTLCLLQKKLIIMLLTFIPLLVSCSNTQPPEETETVEPLVGLSPELLQQLESIGYLQESNVDVAEEIIPIYITNRVQPGYNLYVSGHAPEAILIDMDGNVVHTWHRPFDDIWPGAKMHFFADGYLKNSFRQFHLLEDGEIIVLFELFGIAKLDKDSNIIWKFENVAHHDMDNDDEGRIYSLGKRVETENDEEEAAIWWTYPTINVLDRDGSLLQTIDIYECFVNSPYRHLLKWLQRYGDIFHNNTLRYLDGSHADKLPAFKKGNILVSSPMTNSVFVVDPEKETIVWLIRDLFQFQHDPSLLENGNMLIFNNVSPDGPSSVIEFNPVTQEVVWSYDGGNESFFSSCCSTAQRLPNGNTLITITEQAMAIEVTPEGEIVWQFNNPASVNFDKLAANLYELRRVTPDVDLSWLELE